MGLFAEFSSWVQLGGLLLMLELARRNAGQFSQLEGWRLIWLAFAIGFLGMLESRILLLLITYGIHPSWLTFAGRYVSPLQASLGLLLGMVLISRLLARLRPLSGLIRLPHTAGFVVNAESLVLAWDEGAEDMFGWKAVEAVGKPLLDLIIPLRLRSTHVPVVTRYLSEENPADLSQCYALRCRYRTTRTEFPVEVILTKDQSIDGALRFKAIVRRLMPVT